MFRRQKNRRLTAIGRLTRAIWPLSGSMSSTADQILQKTDSITVNFLALSTVLSQSSSSRVQFDAKGWNWVPHRKLAQS